MAKTKKAEVYDLVFGRDDVPVEKTVFIGTYKQCKAFYDNLGLDTVAKEIDVSDLTSVYAAIKVSGKKITEMRF